MTKSELKTGMVVELLNGQTYVAMIDTCSDLYPDYLMNLEGRGYVDLECYDDNLVCYGAPDLTVMTVRKTDMPTDIHDHCGDLAYCRL